MHNADQRDETATRTEPDALISKDAACRGTSARSARRTRSISTGMMLPSKRTESPNANHSREHWPTCNGASSISAGPNWAGSRWQRWRGTRRPDPKRCGRRCCHPAAPARLGYSLLVDGRGTCPRCPQAVGDKAERCNDRGTGRLYLSLSEQLRGVVSNVKGIYHELLFVHAENIDAI